MLSIENTPPDPPCLLLPCEIPHLKRSSGNEIEKASHKLALPEVVDLSKLPLDPPPTPLSNFSIRDYVFTSRSKDIKTNWPFSQKNLQLCLKHGVKDLLPPFQPLDTARKNQSSKRWTVETTSLQKENISNCNVEPSRSDDAQLKQKKVAEACIDQSSSKFEGENDNENDFPSTTTSNAQSEIGTTDILLEAAGPPASQKTENTARPLSKKCRLIVKFGSKSSSTEDIASNCTALSETMASKVCPVCKTFSSSSNTTLNAHIDQCLSVESTPNWTADSKLIRYRIKPRKTRLMVDIYATAPQCTLEELDRRNGTSWATISSLPAQETEISGEGKKQRVSPVHPEDSVEVDAVYIDANGTKLRILSKFNDSPSESKAGEDIGPTKPLKGGKGGKFLSTKKKKKHGQKHHKYLKLASQSKKFSTLNAHGSQIYGDHGKYNGEEELHEETDSEMQRFKSQEHIKASDSGTLRQWVGSKRTGLAKKVNKKDVHDPLKSKLCASPDMQVESNQPCLGESLADRSYVQRYPVSSKTPISSPEDSEGMENPVYEGLVNDKREQSTGRKRMGSPLAVARIRNDIERSRLPMKRKANQLGKNSTSVCDVSMLNRPKSTGHCVSLMSNKADEIRAGPVNTSVTPPSASTRPSRSCNAFSSKTRHAKLRKNGLSIKKCSPLEKSQMHFLAETDEEVVTWHSEVDQQYDLMHNQTQSQFGRQEINDPVSLGRSSALDTRQQRGATAISSKEEVVAFKCSKSAPHFYGHGEGKNIDSSIELSDDFPRNFDGLESAKEEGMHDDDIFTEPSSKLAVGVRLSKSLGPEFHRLGNHSRTRSNSLCSIEDYKGPLCGSETPRGPTGPNFVDEQDMFCADEVGNIIHGDDGHMVAEFDSEIGQGSCFPEVPIPGPPGSFLPSPGDMGSEDFQGNSSLTTSRVQSSQDQQDLVDGDSSDSPISAASTISNSMAGGANLNSSEPSISVRPPAIQDKFRSGFSGAIVEPSIENAATVAQTTSPGAEMIIPDGDNFNKISIKMGPNSFKIDDQPCCCQKKERISQAVALNYQESQLLRRRAMASGIVPATEKKMGCSPNTLPNHFEARPEIFPLSGCPSSVSGNVVPSVMKCSIGPNPLKNSPDSGMKFSGRSDCESASPSASNPILRLMGKNLMVVNKDEDAPVPAQSHSPNNHLTSQFPSFSVVSPGKIQNQDFHSFHHMVPQGSLIFSEDPRNTAVQYFDVRLSNSLRNPNSKTLAQAPEGMFENQRMRGGFAASLEPPDYQDRQKNRLNSAPTRNLENIVMNSHRQHKNAGFISNPIKEFIVIDDVSETEADLTSNVAKHSTGTLRDHQVVSSCNSFPTVPSYNLWHMNPFSSYHSQEPSRLGESPMVHNDSFPATISRQANASPVKWSCTSEGSSVLKRSPFTAAPSSTGHLRSALYYSSSLL